MQKDILYIIRQFFRNYSVLAILLVLQTAAFIWVGEKFYNAAFFIFTLYFFGRLFSDKINAVHLFGTYVAGIISGGVLYVWWLKGFNLNLLLGAAVLQSAVTALIAAVAAYSPNTPMKIFVFNFKLKIVTVIIMIINFLSIREPALYLAHLSALGVGLGYGFVLSGGFNNVKSYFLTCSSLFRKRAKMKAEMGGRPLSDDEYNAIRAEKQKKIDAILDKISHSGYDSLTKEEKDLLFNSSKN